MTIIGLAANDQSLSIVSKPKVASGDQNSVKVQIDFDAVWDDYGKSAVFFTDKKPKDVYEIILVNGECVIPFEVLEKSGVLYIGVRGVNASEDKVKTSTLVKYKIVDGAPEGNGASVPPTANVYQQLMTAYGKTQSLLSKEAKERKAADSEEASERKAADSAEASERKAEIAVERARIDQLLTDGEVLKDGVLYVVSKSITATTSEKTLTIQLPESFRINPLVFVNVRPENNIDWYFGTSGTQSGGSGGSSSGSGASPDDETPTELEFTYVSKVGASVPGWVQFIIAKTESAFLGGKDAELADLRVGAFGNTYDSAGTGTRSQISNITKNINEFYNGKNINVFWMYANNANAGNVYKNDTGETITTSTIYSKSELIPVEPLQKVTIYAPEGNGKCVTMLGAYFDSNQNLVGGMGYHPNYTSGQAAVVTVPENVYFIGINYHIEHTEETKVIPHTSLPWKANYDKVWCCVGDSLTEENARAEKHYFDYVAEDLGLKVLNYGVSGTGYKNNSFTNRIANMAEEFDFLTIFGSFNDLDESWEIGTLSDTTGTLCGCMNDAIETFMNKYPTKKIGIITPTPWKAGINYFGVETTLENMETYVEALLNVAKKHRIPCLDLYHCSGLNPDNDAVISEFYTENGVEDVGAHPNSKGHKFISSAICEFVKKLI